MASSLSTTGYWWLIRMTILGIVDTTDTDTSTNNTAKQCILFSTNTYVNNTCLPIPLRPCMLALSIKKPGGERARGEQGYKPENKPDIRETSQKKISRAQRANKPGMEKGENTVGVIKFNNSYFWVQFTVITELILKGWGNCYPRLVGRTNWMAWH